MKLFIWRLFLKPGWYHITWNSGLWLVPDRAYWNGKFFTKEFSACSKNHRLVADDATMSIFVKRFVKQ